LATRVSAVKSLLRLIEIFNLEFKQSNGALACIVFESCMSVLLQFGIISSGLKTSMMGCLSSSALCVSGDYLSEQCFALVTRYSSQFSSKAEDTEALVIAECLGAILRRAGEQLEQGSPVWVPLLCVSYIGSRHLDEDVAVAWTAVWNEALSYSGSGNKFSALLRTLPMVATQIVELLHSLSWVQRTIGLSVCRDVASLFPYDVMQVYLYDIITALLSCIKFRIWNGQALVLETLVALLEKYRDIYVFGSWGTGSIVELLSSSSCDAQSGSGSGGTTDMAERDVTEHAAQGYVTAASIIRRHSDPPGSYGDGQRRISEGAGPGLMQVNCVALVELLLRESVRGDKTYRYSAAKALGEMHQSWRYLSKHAPHTSLRFLEVLIHQAGLASCFFFTSHFDYAVFVSLFNNTTPPIRHISCRSARRGGVCRGCGRQLVARFERVCPEDHRRHRSR
jgi:hypothetical protein